MTAPTLTTARMTVEGFSVTHAAILDGTSAATEADLFGVRTASLAPDTGSFDNTGDDSVLSTWSWLNFATLTVESGFISFEMIAQMSGADFTVSDDGDSVSVPLWQEDAGNQPPWPVLVRMASRDRAKNVLYLDFVLYSVQFGPITFQGPAYKTGLTSSYAGKALLSDTDEIGDAIVGPRRVGRVVSTVVA